MLDAAKAFIVRTTDWRSPALLIFRRRLSVVSLMTYPWLPPSASLERPAWTRHQALLALDSGFWARFGLGLRRGFRLAALASGFGWLRLRLGLERSERLAGDFDDRITILIAQLVGTFESRAHFRRYVRRRLLDGVLGVRHLVERHADRRVPRSMPARRRFVRARTPVRIPPV